MRLWSRLGNAVLGLALALTAAPGCGGSDDGGQAWQALGPAGGRIQAVAVDTSTSGTVYAGTQGGGLYRSRDGGVSWTALDLQTSAVSIQELVVAPANPPAVLAVTAEGEEGYEQSWRFLRSTDGGTSWSRIRLVPEPQEAYIRDLLVDPSQPSTVYATAFVTINGSGSPDLFRSLDAGQSWSSLGLDPTLDLASIAIDATEPTTLYGAAGFQSFARSLDGGRSWTRLGRGLPRDSFVNCVAVDPRRRPGTVYVGAVTPGGGPFGVWKSDNRGESFHYAGAGLTEISVTQLEVDSSSAPSRLYALAETFEARTSRLFLSVDEGASWQRVDDGLSGAGVLALARDFAAPGTLYAGTFGRGVFKSTDAGASWSRMTSGLMAAHVQQMLDDPSSSDILYALVDGEVARSRDRAQSWTYLGERLGEASVHDLAIDSSRPTTLYAAADTGVQKSDDAGDHWALVHPWFGGFRFVEIDPARPATVYALGEYGLLSTSSDAGASWRDARDISFSLGSAGLFAAQGRAGTVYAAGWTWGIYHRAFQILYRSDDGGNNLRIVDSAETPRVLLVDPANPDGLYGQVEGGLSKSTNGGLTWQQVSTLELEVLAADPQDPETLYGSDGKAVFRSRDEGKTWKPIGEEGLPTSRVLALTPDTHASGLLYAGTAGSGIYVIQATD